MRGISREAAEDLARINETESSIIIPHYTDTAQLTRCLDSLLKSDAKSSEIIVVDNSFRNASANLHSRDYPGVKFVKTRRNLGSAGGWNTGVGHSSGNLLVFLNDDVVVPNNWLGRIVGDLSEASVGAVSCLTLFQDAPTLVNSAGGVCDFLGFGHNRALGVSLDDLPRSEHSPVFYAVGAAFGTRREIWDEIGGFDPTFFMYAEDLDWSWRVQLAGYDVLVENRSPVYHKWRGSDLDLPSMAYYLERNQMRTILKNYSFGTLLFILPIFAVVKAARILWLLLRRRSLSTATLHAWIWNTGHLSETLVERRRVQSIRSVGDKTIMARMAFESLEVKHALGISQHPIVRDIRLGVKSNE